MILYLDTSALVKLYVVEQGSDPVHSQVSQCEVIATSMVAYPETISAFCRARREDRIEANELNQLIRKLDSDWENFFQVQIDQDLIKRAGELCRDLDLRGFDSIHLASAELIHAEETSFQFACFDERLLDAAKSISMSCL